MENLQLHLVIGQRPVCPNRAPAWTLTSEMVPFGREIREAKHVDQRQAKTYTGLITSTDLWPSRDVYFLEMLALVMIIMSESSFGAYICHRRPAGLHRHQRLLSAASLFLIKITNFDWKKVQDKGLPVEAPCREEPLDKSGLEPAAPNRLADNLTSLWEQFMQQVGERPFWEIQIVFFFIHQVSWIRFF